MFLYALVLVMLATARSLYVQMGRTLPSVFTWSLWSVVLFNHGSWASTHGASRGPQGGAAFGRFSFFFLSVCLFFFFFLIVVGNVSSTKQSDVNHNVDPAQIGLT